MRMVKKINWALLFPLFGIWSQVVGGMVVLPKVCWAIAQDNHV